MVAGMVSVPKNRDQLVRIFADALRGIPGAMRLDEKMLVLGASESDQTALTALGFNKVTLSEFSPSDPSMLAVDAEDIALPSGSFDALFAHEVLHHLRSPHRALCEMLRVARKHVIFMEPNDSLIMRMLVAAGLSFPYELLSVQAHQFASGGVRNTNVPNYIYRWTKREVEKTASSYLAETGFAVHATGYWDFRVDELDLSLRRNTTHLQAVTSILGEGTFLRILATAQKWLNAVPGLRQQGNKFFCVIEKRRELRPWLIHGPDGLRFNRDFSVHGSSVTSGLDPQIRGHG
jgi:SAM-dependent methyltransferase